MPEQHRAERGELAPGIGGTGRVRRRVEDDPLRPRRDRGVELRRRHLEAGVDAAVDRDRRRPGEGDHVGIADPIRGRDDDLVARAERRHQRVEDGVLAADVDRDLVEPVVERVVTAELGAHGFLAGDRAVDDRVLRLAAADRGDRRFLDELGRIEIGLAGTQADDVAAGRLQRRRAIGHGDRRRRLDAVESGGEEGHGHAMPLRRSAVNAQPIISAAQPSRIFTPPGPLPVHRRYGPQTSQPVTWRNEIGMKIATVVVRVLLSLGEIPE